jgi:hypothetical protein
MEEESVLERVWRFLMPVLIAVAIVFVVAGTSFLFWGEFSFPAYSGRLFWGGIAAILVGGFVVVASLGSYSTLGTPSVLTAPGDARVAHSRIVDHLRTNEKRYSFVFRMWAIGILCIAASALVDVLSR